MSYYNEKYDHLSNSHFFSLDDEKKESENKYEFTDILYKELKNKIMGQFLYAYNKHSVMPIVLEMKKLKLLCSYKRIIVVKK